MVSSNRRPSHLSLLLQEKRGREGGRRGRREGGTKKGRAGRGRRKGRRVKIRESVSSQ